MITVAIKDCPDQKFTVVKIFLMHGTDKPAIEAQLEKQHDYINTLHINLLHRQPRNLRVQAEPPSSLVSPPYHVIHYSISSFIPKLVNKILANLLETHREEHFRNRHGKGDSVPESFIDSIAAVRKCVAFSTLRVPGYNDRLLLDKVFIHTHICGPDKK